MNYILVDQNRVRVEHYTRRESNAWALRDYQTPGDELKLPSIGAAIPLARI